MRYGTVLIEMALRSCPDRVIELLKELGIQYSNEQVLSYVTLWNHREGQLFMYERMKLYSLLVQECDPE